MPKPPTPPLRPKPRAMPPDHERVTDPEPFGTDPEYDGSLRPRTLTEFVGQEGLREQLRITVEAARGRGEAMDHILFHGPPGLGKTTLASILAAEMGVSFVQTSGRTNNLVFQNATTFESFEKSFDDRP